jgi:hypothetical protein
VMKQLLAAEDVQQQEVHIGHPFSWHGCSVCGWLVTIAARAATVTAGTCSLDITQN